MSRSEFSNVFVRIVVGKRSIVVDYALNLMSQLNYQTHITQRGKSLRNETSKQMCLTGGLIKY